MLITDFLTKFRRLPIEYPMIRGMMSYALIWPTCSVVQEYLEHGTALQDADWNRAKRFGIFGTFFMAPAYYSWMKYTSRFFKTKNLKVAFMRAMIEQVTYGPLALSYFFFGMSALEMKPFGSCVNEVREKFWPTYKIGMLFWPAVQTFNFHFVREHNRILTVSMASFVWTVFMAHMKAKEQKNVVIDPDLRSDVLNTDLKNAEKSQVK